VLSQARVLEADCGSGANLWMIAHDGFETHGSDLSPESLILCEQMLRKWDTTASLKQGDMTAHDYADNFFDVVADVFSLCCVPEKLIESFLDEVSRVLKPGGRFFSYHPPKKGDAFRETGLAPILDARTLDEIRWSTSPYYPQDLPFRFIDTSVFATMLKLRSFNISQNERISRTYGNMSEYFQFVRIRAEKAS
jgi:ubiquinone/menaquinone biosynthesis C-methylase UbiE